MAKKSAKIVPSPNIRALTSADDPTLGIDLSDHNGAVNFGELYDGIGDHVRYIWQKSTEGATFTAKTLDRNMRAAAEYDWALGCYHFAYPSPSANRHWPRLDAESEADHYIETVSPYKSAIALAHILDYEHPRFQSMRAEQCAVWVKTWAERVSKAFGGDPVWLYCNRYFGDTLIKPKAEAVDWRSAFSGLWVARYMGGKGRGDQHFNAALSGNRPQPVAGFPRVDCWQWTENGGSLPGIDGPRLDVNLWLSPSRPWLTSARKPQTRTTWTFDLPPPTQSSVYQQRTYSAEPAAAHKAQPAPPPPSPAPKPAETTTRVGQVGSLRYYQLVGAMGDDWIEVEPGQYQGLTSSMDWKTTTPAEAAAAWHQARREWAMARFDGDPHYTDDEWVSLGNPQPDASLTGPVGDLLYYQRLGIMGADWREVTPGYYRGSSETADLLKSVPGEVSEAVRKDLETDAALARYQAALDARTPTGRLPIPLLPAPLAEESAASAALARDHDDGDDSEVVLPPPIPDDATHRS